MELVMTTNDEFENYKKAKKQVTEIKGFYSHLLTYVIVMIILVYINLKYSPEYLWFLWTMLGWGIGLFFHAMKVFKFVPFLGKDWEQKKMQQFMDEQKNKTNKYQ